MSEVWKSVDGYEGAYEVSNYGRVRNKNGKLIRMETHCKGYQRVDLFKNGKRKHFKVHRLVASAFIPNPEGKPQVNHKDFDKKNNTVANLEWVTNLENAEWSMTGKCSGIQMAITDYMH